MAAKESVQSLAECAICLQLLEKPKQLPCLHTFCLHCLEELYKDAFPEDAVKCASCRKEFNIPGRGPAGLPHDFKMESLADMMRGKVMATVAPAARPQCTKPQTHCVTYCVKHTDKPLELYCFTCKETICMKCAVVGHRQHECQEIDQYADDVWRKIDTNMEKIADKIISAHKMLDTLNAENKNLQKSINDVEEKIKQAGEQVKRQVDSQVNQLLIELEMMKAEAHKDMDSNRQRIELELEKLKSFSEFVKRTKANNESRESTRSAHRIQVEADEILKTNFRAGEWMSRYIEFVPNNTEDSKSSENLVGLLATCKIPVLRPRAVDMFRDGGPVYGVTSLGNKLYILNNKNEECIEVYSASTHDFQYSMSVPHKGQLVQISSCEHCRCLYVVDNTKTCIHRLDVELLRGKSSSWLVEKSGPIGLSVTGQHNILVTFHKTPKLIEFTTNGEKIREISLQADILHLWHAVQLPSGQFVVCHGNNGDPLHRVCITDADGKITRSYGGASGPAPVGQLNVPRHLGVNKNGQIFVADITNRRVLLLSSTLQFVSEILSGDELTWEPSRLCVNDEGRNLYVTDVEWNSGCKAYTAGRVIRISV